MKVDRPSDQSGMLSDARALQRLSQRRRRPSQIFHKVTEGTAPLPRWANIALIAVFISSIVLPLGGMLLNLDSSFVLQENRILTSRPRITLERKALAELPTKFESYFNDQFGFRQRLIHWLSISK